MVQKALIILFLLFPSIVRAEVNLEFSEITIPEFAQAVLKGIIKKNYVLSPDVLNDARTITMSIKNTSETDLLPLITSILDENGIGLAERAGFIYLTRKPLVLPELPAVAPSLSSFDSQHSPSATQPEPSDLQIYSYKPLYREQKEITDLLNFAGARVNQSTVDDVIFYRASEETQDILTNLLADLDKPSSEVIVKAYIYEVSNNVTDVNAISAALSLLNRKLGMTLDVQPQANQLKLTLPSAEILISAFDSDNRFKQVSSPSLRVKHGKNSRFSVGTETPVISSTTTTNNGNPVQSIVYRSSGVILDITPRIFAETIELDITQQLSSFVPTTNGVNNSPTLIKREIKTVVNTKHGELILLGGLNESKVSNQRQGLKFLPDFLHNKNDTDDKSDILLVMQVQRL
ncbi:Secretin XcpQ [Methylophilaceae bacterium]|nr:Secretin XcpQ [Methylophilaceae bacterium]